MSDLEVQRREDQSIQRRGFFSLLGKLGLAMAAGGTALLPSGHAAAHGYHYQCCHLANPHDPSCSCSGVWKHQWSCCYGTKISYCLECWDASYPGPPTSCWDGYFRCSKATATTIPC